MLYDLIIIDLDGTLVGPDGVISARNRDAVDRARDDGIEVIIATGRAPAEAGRYLEMIEHEGLLIAAGGALLTDVETGLTMDRRELPAEVVSEVTHLFVEQGHKALILKDPTAVGYDYLAVGPHEMNAASAWWFDTQPIELRFAPHVDDDPHPHDSVRAGIVADEDDMGALAAEVRATLGERVTFQHWAAVTAESATGGPTHLLEVFQVDVNKWTMVETICRRRGLDPGRVAAIGDGLNDVELVEGAALGVAMGNADPRVTAVADRVTGDHAQDGVADAIHRMLSGAW